MKLLPPPGPERRRLTLMVGALVVIALLYWQFGTGSSLPPPPQTTGPAATSNLAVNTVRPGVGRARNEPQEPQPLKFAEMEVIPDEPQAGRNLFVFGVRPPPPPPPYVPPPQPAYTPPPAPTPTGPPPIPLKLNLVVVDPATGKRRAYLQYERDQSGTGYFEITYEGQVVDGKYRVLTIGDNSVRVSYLDGSGLRTIQVGR